jgi:hypothetical protein
LPVAAVVRPPNHPPRVGVNFTEAVGEKVAFINYIDDMPEWLGLGVLSFAKIPSAAVSACF